MMPTYEATISAVVRVNATNAMAAKAALEAKMGGSRLLRVIGSHSGSGHPPSGGAFGWKWNVKVMEQTVSSLRRVSALKEQK